MIDRGRKSNYRLMIQDQKDVTRTIIKVALYCAKELGGDRIELAA